MEVNLPGPLELLAEIDGRNANAGLGMSLGSLRTSGGMNVQFNASVWGLYLQNLRKESKDIGLSPAYSGKLGISIALPSMSANKSAKPEDGKAVYRSLLHIPGTEVLPGGGMSVSADLRGFVDYKSRSTAGLPKMRTGFAVNYGLMDNMEAGITLYSGDSGFKLASGQFRIKIFDESDFIPAISAGFMDITGARHPVEYSGYPITLSSYSRYAENKSMYLVAKRSVWFLGNVYAGIGGGRFRGYGPINKKLHGAFGGGEINLPGPFSLLGEMDGRNANAGLGMSLGQLRAGKGLDVQVNASIWGLYLQNLRKVSKDIGLSPAYSAKLDFTMILPSIDWNSPARKAGASGVGSQKVQVVELRPRLIAFSNPIADWQINLTTPKGEIIRSFHGVGLPPKVFEWDGLDDSGYSVGSRAKIQMELTVRDVTGIEKMDVVPVKATRTADSRAVKPVRSEYGEVISAMMDWNKNVTTQLGIIAGKTDANGRISMYQVRANELLAYLARKAGKPAEALQYSRKAAELARLGVLSTKYTCTARTNVWSLAGELLGDYRLWSLIYEANMDTMKSPRELIPAGRVLRIPSDVLEEDLERCITMFQNVPPPEDFDPTRKNESEE